MRKEGELYLSICKEAERERGLREPLALSSFLVQDTGYRTTNAATGGEPVDPAFRILWIQKPLNWSLSSVRVGIYQF